MSDHELLDWAKNAIYSLSPVQQARLKVGAWWLIALCAARYVSLLGSPLIGEGLVGMHLHCTEDEAIALAGFLTYVLAVCGTGLAASGGATFTSGISITLAGWSVAECMRRRSHGFWTAVAGMAIIAGLSLLAVPRAGTAIEISTRLGAVSAAILVAMIGLAPAVGLARAMRLLRRLRGDEISPDQVFSPGPRDGR